MKKEILIFGHKNPDTDSVCAAISLAYLRNRMVEESANDGNRYWGQFEKDSLYIPMAAGEPNSETSYVLDRFGVKAPDVNKDIRRQIKDISLKYVEPFESNISLKDAWIKFQEEEAYTVPVKENGQIKGILTVGDVSRTFMNVHDKALISKGKTPYRNLIDTIEGELITGDENDIIDSGKLIIIAANPEMMGKNLEAGDIAILSDDEEAQRKLIDIGAKCMILCNSTSVSEDIKKAAEEKGVVIIVTPYNTYKTSKVINQAIPIKYFILPIEEVCGFASDDYIDDIRDTVTTKRHRDFPVTDSKGNFTGMITRTSLMDMSSKKVVLVDHNEISQGVFGLSDADVLEIVDHHKLGTVETMQPISVVNRPVGCTCTIIYSMYKENGINIPDEIKGILCSAILSDTMLFKSPTCTPEDRSAAEELAKSLNIDLEELWNGMLKASLDLESKSEKEILYQDYKIFEADGLSFGAGQILAADSNDVEIVKSRLVPYLEIALEEEGIDFISLMITDVSADSTELIFCGDNAKGIIESAFGKKSANGSVYLEGVVSRKKQLIPPIMAVLQQ